MSLILADDLLACPHGEVNRRPRGYPAVLRRFSLNDPHRQPRSRIDAINSTPGRQVRAGADKIRDHLAVIQYLIQLPLGTNFY